MAKFAQGLFTPKNAQKYVGKHTPRYRSGWELTFMNFCDNNNSCLLYTSPSPRDRQKSRMPSSA